MTNSALLPMQRYGLIAVIYVHGRTHLDGSDMSQLRDTLSAEVNGSDVKTIALDILGVEALPSGFFGLLCNWYDLGYRIILAHPSDSVMGYEWMIRQCKRVTKSRQPLLPIFELTFDGEPFTAAELRVWLKAGSGPSSGTPDSKLPTTRAPSIDETEDDDA